MITETQKKLCKYLFAAQKCGCIKLEISFMHCNRKIFVVRKLILFENGQFSSRCVYVNNVLIKPSLHNNTITVTDNLYNYLAKLFHFLYR